MSKRGIALSKKIIAVIIIVVVIAAAAGTLAFVYLGPREVEEVRIGNLASMTGPLAAFGGPAAWAIRKCIEDVNRIGGLIIEGRRLPVRLIQYDDSSDPAKATALAEQLILQDKVHIVLTNPGPPIIHIPISKVADKLKVPFLVDGVMEPWREAGPYKYAWAIGPVLIMPIPEGDFRAGKPGYQVMINYLLFTNMFRDRTNGRVALFAPDDADGRAWYDLASKVLMEAGYIIVGVEKRLGQYAPGTMDFTPIIREWKDTEAEILWGLSVGADFAVMWRQAYMLGWKPKMVLDGRSLKNLDDVLAIGDPKLTIGLTDPFNVWNPYIPYKSYYGGRTNIQLVEEWTKETGKAWTDCLSAYSWAEVACRVIELAGSLDPEKINEAFYKVDVVAMAFGRVKFVPEWHYNPQPLFVGQWVVEDGKLEMEIVWSPIPDVPPTREPIFPLP